MAFIFRGNIYDNLASLAEDYNIPLLAFSNRIYADWPIGEVVDMGAINKKIIYKGKKYRSYKELGDCFNLDYNLIVDRLRKKWSIEDIIEKRKTTSKCKLLSNPVNQEIVELSDRIQLFELYALLHCPEIYKNVIEKVEITNRSQAFELCIKLYYPRFYENVIRYRMKFN